jgi:hypothetical protein
VGKPAKDMFDPKVFLTTMASISLSIILSCTAALDLAPEMERHLEINRSKIIVEAIRIQITPPNSLGTIWNIIGVQRFSGLAAG